MVYFDPGLSRGSPSFLCTGRFIESSDADDDDEYRIRKILFLLLMSIALHKLHVAHFIIIIIR